MEEQLISFETAKLAKEKGFNQNPYLTRRSYGLVYTDGSDVQLRASSLFSPETNICVAPSQSLLQKWLREINNLHIEIYCNASGWGWMITKINGSLIKDIDNDTFFDSYEQALEEGLKQVLNLM